MRLVKLRLRNFRNLAAAQIEFPSGLVVIEGNNAQGKTNLLEAIYMCCTARSHRTFRDREVIAYGEETAFVSADCAQRDGLHRVEIGFQANGRKSIGINGQPVKRLGELMGHMNAVLFSPEEMSLVKDGPAWRRRFMDICLSQMKPGYFFALQQYMKAADQRNALLKAIQKGESGRDTLPVWEEQMAAAGAYIVQNRARFLAQLAEEAAMIHQHVSGGKERLELGYEASAQLDAGPPLDEQLARLWERHREQDIRRGTTGLGPHHEDVAFLVNGQDARAFGSQGQQRTAALAAKLAQLTVMRQEVGESPLLLLDDVFSELDEGRREMLLEYIHNTQTLLTCVDFDAKLLGGRQDGALYRMKAGVLNAHGQ